jgi:hypothetical protein
MHGDGVLALDKAHVGLRASSQESTKASAAYQDERGDEYCLDHKKQNGQRFLRCCCRDSLVLLRCADSLSRC